MENLNVEPEYYKNGYTVGELLDFIEKHNIPRNGKVLIQRVEDRYFEGCDVSGMIGQLPDGTYGKLPPGSKAKGWHRVARPDYMHHHWVEKIADMKARPRQYPNITPERIEEYQKAVDDGTYMNEYTVVHSPVGYDDYKHLYLDSHY